MSEMGYPFNGKRMSKGSMFGIHPTNRNVMKGVVQFPLLKTMHIRKHVLMVVSGRHMQLYRHIKRQDIRQQQWRDLWLWAFGLIHTAEPCARNCTVAHVVLAILYYEALDLKPWSPVHIVLCLVEIFSYRWKYLHNIVICWSTALRNRRPIV